MATGSPLEPIPHPPGHLIVGDLFDLGSASLFEGLTTLAREYGRIYRIDLPGGNSRVVVSGVALVDELCDESRFDKSRGPDLRAHKDGPTGHALFTSETTDPAWLKAHNILMPAFSLDAIREQGEDVWRLLQQEAVIFVCGDASRMAPDVRQAFATVFRERTGASEADALAWLTGLAATHRYLEDIWASSG